MARPHTRSTFSILAILAIAFLNAPAQAQTFRSSVGGVTIDANGVLDVASSAMQKSTADMLRQKMQAVPEELGTATDLRMVSLRSLSEQIAALGVQSTADLPDELRCLAGLLRVEYVIIVSERNDIVLAGPAEAWA